jgi:outer membrane protein assembly factor BamB
MSILRFTGFLALLVPAPALAAQEAAADFEDPAPPEVRELPAVEVPAAKAYPELTFHRAPGPLAADAVVEDWPGFLGPGRDGRSRETRLRTDFPEEGPPLLWEMERGQGFASPVIVGERLVYTHRVGDESVVDCLERETGERFWRFAFPTDYVDEFIDDGGPRSTPVVVGDRVYVHGLQGELFCLDLPTGRVVWERDLAKELGTLEDFFGTVSSPVVHDGLLIQNVGAPGGPSVAAFELDTGRLAWGAGTEWGPSCASPLIRTIGDRPKALVLAGGKSKPPTGGLMVMDAATGALELTFPFRSRTYLSVTGSTPVLAGTNLFLSSAYGVGSAGLAFRGEEGFQEVWRNRHFAFEFSTPVADGGTLYAIDGVNGRAGAFVSIDPGTGEELARLALEWSATYTVDGEEKTVAGSVGAGSLLWAEGRFLCLGDRGDLLTIEATPEEARVVARTALFNAPQSWTPPVVSRGLLYVCQNQRERFGTNPPRLLCYDLRAR